ncbi:MAG: hypothetical protein NT062_24470 [Proteobacteria bacterium]|nr:hypothetical protein [Pseudomonadota bacterium]
MARGRAPSHHAYRGALGQTRRKLVHAATDAGDLIAVEIVTAVDALTDPDLADRLHEGALNVVRIGSRNVTLAVSVLFHDPAAEIMVLVIPDAMRHRAFEERIAILEQLRSDDAVVPAYVKDFGVVFGHEGLVGFVEAAEKASLASRDADQRRTEVGAREVEIDRRTRELERARGELDVAKAELRAQTAEQRLGIASQTAELERTRAEIDKARAEIDKARAELERSRAEARARVIAAAQQPPEEKTTVVAVASIMASASGPVIPVPTPAPAPTPTPTIVQVVPEDAPNPPPSTNAEPDDRADDEVLTSARQYALPPIDQSVDFEAVSTGEVSLPAEFDEDPTDASEIPVGSDPLTTETATKPIEGMPDPWLVDAMRQPTSSFLVQGARVRLALVASPAIYRHLGGDLDVRVMLYRTPDAPVVALVFGSPTAMRVPNLAQLLVVVLDVARELDRHVLASLTKKFALDVEIVVREGDRSRQGRRVELTAPLADNVGYIVRAADDHLRGVSADGTPSFDLACQRVLSPTFDLLGTTHTDTAEFRDDKLAQVDTASSLRRAIAMARRFARPSREDYLVCTRGFPLVRWRELRRHVLAGAVTWGLWMGPELAQVAVSEGLARSRRDLVVRLEQGFEALRRHPVAFDLDDDAAADNTKALAEEARNLGVEIAPKKRDSVANVESPRKRDAMATIEISPRKRDSVAPGAKASTAVALSSEDAPVASGSIHTSTPPHGAPALARRSGPAIAILNTPKAVRATDELIGMLDSREHRLGAAIELCDRGVGSAATQIIAAASKMSRADAVRVLGMSVKLGEAAKGPLVEGLASSKAYLRHGCALALAMLRTEDGTQAVIDLLLTEPTEIWREVARAIGQVGPTALMPLASNMGRLGDRATPALAERVAWAMAHVGVRGGKGALETMGGGQSVVAPVARKALELISMAARDEVRVRPVEADHSQPGRDVTINRAFSRRFFEALEQGSPEEGQAALAQLEASSPMELLDENDLIEDDEIDASELDDELDESDLIHQ